MESRVLCSCSTTDLSSSSSFSRRSSLGTSSPSFFVLRELGGPLALSLMPKPFTFSVGRQLSVDFRL